MAGLDDIANKLLTTRAAGVLSTHSQKHPGFPFGSLTPFAHVEATGVVLLMSNLAEHVKNLEGDPRCSLMLAEPVAEGVDPQSAARATLLCEARPARDAELEQVRAPYLARHAGAERLLAMKDFRFWVLAVRHTRVIEGFGRMGWL